MKRSILQHPLPPRGSAVAHSRQICNSPPCYTATQKLHSHIYLHLHLQLTIRAYSLQSQSRGATLARVLLLGMDNPPSSRSSPFTSLPLHNPPRKFHWGKSILLTRRSILSTSWRRRIGIEINLEKQQLRSNTATMESFTARWWWGQ